MSDRAREKCPECFSKSKHVRGVVDNAEGDMTCNVKSCQNVWHEAGAAPSLDTAQQCQCQNQDDSDGAYCPLCGKCKIPSALANIPYLLAEAERLRRELCNLLAIIHRDGGQKTGELGLEESVNLAHKVWAELITKADEAERLRGERDQLKRRLGDMASSARTSSEESDL